MIKVEFAKDWTQVFEKAGLESFIITEKIKGPPLTDFVAANWPNLVQPPDTLRPVAY